MDTQLLTFVGLSAIVFLFILPSWTPVEPQISIRDASATNNSVSFSFDYQAPSAKSCYAVVYGPFAYDRPGHEEGNNIYVFGDQGGSISDTLALQAGESLESLRVELWCDRDKLLAREVPL